MQIEINRPSLFEWLFPPKINKYKIPLPNGNYKAEWSGWNIKIFEGNTETILYNVETTQGLRGTEMVLAKIRNGNIKEMIQ